MAQRILTSWKEIASYVGKGVRTVQRWERELGFPIRRPAMHIVTALPDEIDAWVKSFLPASHTRYEIQKQASELRVEGDILRADRETIIADLLRTDLDLALTFARMALNELDTSEKKTRTLSNARKAYDAVVYFGNRIDIPKAHRKEIEERLRSLKALLERLGESFSQ